MADVLTVFFAVTSRSCGDRLTRMGKQLIGLLIHAHHRPRRVVRAFVAALVFANRIRDGYVFLASSLWVWILGTASYYLIPTLGPFASAPKEFAQLPHTLITSAQTKYMADRTHFLQHPAASDAFNSVNAFASLHVGFTFMVLLMMRYYGFRRATRVMTVYVVAVIIATIYLGWHFALDDLAGLLLAYLAVLFGRLMIYPKGRQTP